MRCQELFQAFLDDLDMSELLDTLRDQLLVEQPQRGSASRIDSMQQQKMYMAKMTTNDRSC